MKNRKNRKRWTCKKSRTFNIPKPKGPDRKKETLKKLRRMSSQERRQILEEKGILSNVSTPDGLVDTILYTLI
tara:strand:- start:24285 stop:24503 length:219 start_codon:yes stop_codon:yes gene_type:complete